MEKKEKKINSALRTKYEPDLPWNLWLELPMEKNPGIPRPEGERVVVEIDWPTGEEFDRLTSLSSSTAIFYSLAKACAVKIEHFSFQGESVETGVELAAVRSRGATRCRELMINIGSHIFRESLLTEEEIKN